jgi:methylenetetrahydrofolate reductase (NADPH)
VTPAGHHHNGDPSRATSQGAHEARCPKQMTHGPCGGVDAGGGCEVAPLPCPWVDRPIVAWAGPAPTTPRRHRLLDLMAARPIVVADLPTRPLDRAALRRSADLLAGACDAVLTGDNGGERVQFPPSYRAHLLAGSGVAVWAGLNCRDRNRVALEGELAALADAGAAAVHCVTGDHTSIGHRPDAAPVFDLDSTQLAALARAAGLLTSVGEAPCGPPAGVRPARLAEKVRAGAHVCFVNHAGGAGPVARFVAAGPDVPYVACVPVVLDRVQAELISGFTGFVLPGGFLAAVLDAPDPEVAGIDAAVTLAQDLLAVPGVRGVNLSAVPGPDAAERTARAMATIGRALGAGAA